MMVRAVADFRDLVEEVDRVEGDEWEVDEARFQSLNGTRYGTLVESIEGAAPKQVKVPKKPSRQR